jgi:hypothetical protein
MMMNRQGGQMKCRSCKSPYEADIIRKLKKDIAEFRKVAKDASLAFKLTCTQCGDERTVRVAPRRKRMT